MIYTSESIKETQKIATELVKKLPSLKTQGAKVIALEGELGAGKTVFVKGLARALKMKDKIKSPTFVIVKKYILKFKIPARPAGGLNLKFLYHLDYYRLRDEKDLEVLGIKEILNDPQNLVLIEWSDRVKKILPKKHIKIHIDHVDKNTRKITIK